MDASEQSRDYRAAWSRFATGVTVITTIEPGGKVHGMTANGVASVSLDPPLALVCVGHSRNTYRLIESTGRFGISVLADSQVDIAEYFRRDPEHRTGDVRVVYKTLPGGWPVIDGALTRLGCTVTAAHNAGDHTIFVGEVEQFETDDGRPLIWYESEFTVLTES